MKTFFIPLLALLLLALPPSAQATLCAQCNGKVFTADIGQCKVCADGITTSGAFKLCKKCSTKLAQCEACQEDLKPKTVPPPAVEAPPAKPKAYPDHWGAPPRTQTKDLRALPGGYGTRPSIKGPTEYKGTRPSIKGQVSCSFSRSAGSA